MLPRLPRHSHYKAAIAQDEDLARAYLARPAEQGPQAYRPPITEHSALVEVLTTVIDELRELHATLIAVNSRKGRRPKVTRAPRPETAVMRLEKDRSVAMLADLERRLTPDGS